MWKKSLLGLLAVVLLGAAGSGAYVYALTSAYDESMSKVYDIPPVDTVKAATDPASVERGRHLAESIAGCALADCHGADLGGGKVLEMGPLGTMSGPNITRVAQVYTDAELARLLRHGIKNDGRSVRFMPSTEFGWLPDDELAALIGYIRTVKPVDRVNGPMEFGTLAKVLDRRGALHIDVARVVNSRPIDLGPEPSATKEYGRYVAKLCTGCHGEQLGGGPIPGAPPDMAVPLNITPDPTGLGPDYSYEQWEKLIHDGIKKDGATVDPFMPIEALQNMNDLERKALYTYLMSQEPRPFGSR